MPPAVQPPMGLGAWSMTWIIVGGLLLAIANLAIRHPMGALVGGVILGLLWMEAGRETKRRHRRLQTLADARPGGSICEFARAFDLRGTDPWVVRATFEALQDELRDAHPAFPVRAEDRLVEDLEIDGDDLDMDLAPAVASRSGRSLDGGSMNPWWGRVRTAGDLVHYLNAQPRTR